MDVPTPLAGIAASLPIKKAILLPIHVQTNPSIAETSTCNTIETSQADDQEWTNAITEYLRTGTLPGDPKQAHKIRVQAALFTLIGGHLYKRSFTGPYLRCLSHSEALYVLAELHKGHRIPNFCSELNIRNSYSTPRYPQSNGQAEATNETLITALKKRLEQAKGKWVEELPGILWAYRTTPGRPIGNTPFAIAYGMDAVIPTEIGLPTIRTEAAKQDDADAELGRTWTGQMK
ncbi:hypothetical protein CK203_002459 [Vitis vinifera]|uniref:Integrase catalytic domain-containing protein n=1 Tax=Vitis vinifera TaxID=29760 RepID=A0A438KH46_VITVI|nr:hypothetical protein CK203_002459 [Vitis vinifera]